MKVLAIPDLHCFAENYSRPNEHGTPSRLIDWMTTADALEKLAAQEHVDLAVAPGDFFVNPKPSPRAIVEVAGLFDRLEDAGIPVVGCAGNHDVPGPGLYGPVDLISELGNWRWGITAPGVVPQAGIQVAVLPWVKPASLLQGSETAGDLVARTSAALLDITRRLAAQLDLDKPAILIGHWPVAGCVTSSGQVLSGNEPALPLHELQSLPFRAVIMGHIHKPQVFPGRPIVLHTGAFQRNDFGEERDERGAYVIDLETGEAEWHELPVRRFHTVEFSPSEIDRLWVQGGGFGGFLPGLGAVDDIAGAICRVKYRATEEQHRQIDQTEIIRALEEAGAHQVAGVFPEIIKADRARASGLTEQTSPLEALDAWLAMRTDLADELKAEVRQAADTLMKEVETGATHADRAA